MATRKSRAKKVIVEAVSDSDLVDHAIEKTEFWSSGIERITLDRSGMLVVTPRDPRSQMPYVKQLSTDDVEKLH